MKKILFPVSCSCTAIHFDGSLHLNNMYEICFVVVFSVLLQ